MKKEFYDIKPGELFERENPMVKGQKDLYLKLKNGVVDTATWYYVKDNAFAKGVFEVLDARLDIS